MIYFIKPNIYSVSFYDTSIVLDLNTNRYLAFNDFSKKIWDLIKKNADLKNDIETSVQIGYFKEEKLISDKKTKNILKDNPVSSIVSKTEIEIDSEKFSISCFFYLVYAKFIYKIILRRKSILKILLYIQKTRERKIIINDNRLKTMVFNYRLLRKILKIGEQDCLPRTAILSLALAYRGIDSKIVIGVDNFPFKAHAWLEKENILLNDRKENLSQMKIIASF